MSAAITSVPDALARVGHALSDPTRASVLLALLEGPGYPSELADEVGASRQSMSNHLACLRGCGMVVAVPEGRRTRYEIADPRLGYAVRSLHDAVIVTAPELCPQPAEKGCC